MTLHADLIAKKQNGHKSIQDMSFQERTNEKNTIAFTDGTDDSALAGKLSG
jgi:hypothetical protein